LELSENPFATVVMAHLKVLETKRNVDQRKAWKFRLTRALYEKGYQRQQILDLYRFIDWVMILPEAAERAFWQELQAFEEERKVTYISNAERFGFERGIERGIEQGASQEARSLVVRLLNRRIGMIAPNIETQIAALSVSQLEELGEALLDFSSPTDLTTWLRSQSVSQGELRS
jgi:predicted transposase YdaD